MVCCMGAACVLHRCCTDFLSATKLHTCTFSAGPSVCQESTGDPTTFGSLDDHAHHVLHLLAVAALRPAARRLLQAPAVRTRAGCHRVADQQLPAALGKELRRSTQTHTQTRQQDTAQAQ